MPDQEPAAGLSSHRRISSSAVLSSLSSSDLNETRPSTSDGLVARKQGQGQSQHVRASKKRKRVESELDELLKDPVVLKVHESSILSVPFTIQPRFILPRAYLPLSYLDTAASTAGYNGRLFSSYILALEREGRALVDATYGPITLIAEAEQDKSLYAVERTSYGLYAICRLGGWVKPRELREAALAVRMEPLGVVVDPLGLSPWKDVSKIEAKTLGGDVARKKEKKDTEATSKASAAITPTVMSRTGEKRPASTTVEIPSSPPLEPLADLNQLPAEVTPLTTTADAAASPDEALDLFHEQYLNALYLTSSSLAYFAKTSLSRVRAMIGTTQAADSGTLLDFLKRYLMTLTTFDKKFKTTIPEIAGGFAMMTLSDAEDPTSTKKQSRKKKRKIKRGKDCLFPTEANFIKRWWFSSDVNTALGEMESAAEKLKRRVADLRLRESQLHIIVILEVLALEKSVSREMSPTLPGEDLPKKTKKEPKLKTSLDLHLDRLCIWQSFLDPSKGESKGPLTGNTLNRKNNDRMLDFCNEVIMAFYGSRLPDICASISRKLGATHAVSPAPAERKRPTKPGQPTRRPTLHHARAKSICDRPLDLEQALNEDRSSQSQSRAHSRAPSLGPGLQRPGTPGDNSKIKRESSDLANLITASRGGILKAKNFHKREVDLNRVPGGRDLSKAVPSSRKSKANVEDELKEAIFALKKPNRTLVSSEYVRSGEIRTQGKSRKSKPTRLGHFESVQVSATPKAKRTKTMGGLEPSHLSKEASRLSESNLGVSPSPGIAISSSAELGAQKKMHSHSRVLDGDMFQGITASPLRGFSKLTKDPTRVLDSSPVHGSATPSRQYQTLLPPQFKLQRSVTSAPSLGMGGYQSDDGLPNATGREGAICATPLKSHSLPVSIVPSSSNPASVERTEASSRSLFMMNKERCQSPTALPKQLGVENSFESNATAEVVPSSTLKVKKGFLMPETPVKIRKGHVRGVMPPSPVMAFASVISTSPQSSLSQRRPSILEGTTHIGDPEREATFPSLSSSSSKSHDRTYEQRQTHKQSPPQPPQPKETLIVEIEQHQQHEHEHGHEHTKGSIYSALGWDQDFDDL